MLKYITMFTLLFVLMAGPAEALDDFGGNIGVEYSTLRSEFNWQVGLNYTIEDILTVGFDIHNWTTQPRRNDVFPFVGLASISTYYLWYVNLDLTDNMMFKIKRYCEHWMSQSGDHNDYMGLKFGVEYSF